MKPLLALLVLSASLLGEISIRAQNLPQGVITQIDKVFEQWNRADSPGCALGAYKNGRIVYKHGYGMASQNDDVPITPETVFQVASMSKQSTAASFFFSHRRVSSHLTMMCISTQYRLFAAGHRSEPG